VPHDVRDQIVDFVRRWSEDWEKQAIIGFHLKNPLEG
jgi:hypothetical protein